MRNDLHQVGLWVCLWGVFLINNDVGGPSHSTVSGAAPGQEVLGCIR